MTDAEAALPESPQPPTRPGRKALTIRTIGPGDVLEALGDGLRDLRSAPQFGLAFGGFYALLGWLMLAVVFTFDADLYAFPMATGFALVAPFVAAGCYEVSRRLEAGRPLRWREILLATRSAGGNDLNWMAVVTVFAYIIWIDIAMALYVIFYGFRMIAFTELVEMVFTTGYGILFFLIGSAVGTVLGVFVFAITAISFPILFERQVDFVTAMITSVRAVAANPVPMGIWCGLIGASLAASMLSGFVALLVVLPVLGFTTWHLYRRLIGPADSGGV